MPQFSFLDEIETVSKTGISSCYQCCRCTNGCPVAQDMDIVPHRLIRYIIDGEQEKALSSGTIWTCLNCATCSVRCPNGIDVARVFETLRVLSVEAHLAATMDTRLFDEIFIENISKHGRLYEMEAVMRYRLHKKEFFGDADMGLAMVRKGRIGLTPHNIRDRKNLGKVMREMAGKVKI